MEAIAVSIIEPELNVVEVVEIGEEFQRILEEKYKSSYGKKVIELGVGPRSFISLLRDKMFGEKVFRMELGDWNLRNDKINKGMVQGELQCLPIASNSVDVVVSPNRFELEFELQRAVQEIERILIAGGEAIIMVHGDHFKEGRLAMETGLKILESRKLGEGKECECWMMSLKKG